MLRPVLSERDSWEQLQAVLPQRRAIEEAASVMAQAIGPEATCALLEFLQLQIESVAKATGVWNEDMAADLFGQSERAAEQMQKFGGSEND